MAKKENQVAKEVATDQNAPKYVSRVKQRYLEEVVPYLVKRFNYTNINQVPKLVKITLNTGIGDCKDNARHERRYQSNAQKRSYVRFLR